MRLLELSNFTTRIITVALNLSSVEIFSYLLFNSFSDFAHPIINLNVSLISSTYSAPNTTINLSLLNTTLGVVSSLSNAAISDVYIGNVNRCGSHLDYLNWTPTLSASGSMTFTSTSIDLASFTVKGKTLLYQCAFHGTTGGTASNTLYFTLPITSANTSANQIGGGCRVFDGAGLSGSYLVDTNGTRVGINKYDNSNWNLGASKYVYVSGSYSI